MANTLYVSEFSGMSGYGPFPAAPSLADQGVAIGDASAQSAAFQAATGLIRVVADASCAIAVGTDPTALITSLYLPANVPSLLAVPIGKSYKVAVIAAS